LCLGSSNREVLTGSSSKKNLPPAVFTNFTWNTIRNFSHSWSNPESPLFDNINNVWLEFDVENDKPTSAIPEPSFFFGPKGLSADFPASSYQWVTKVALKSLLGSHLTPQVERNLLKCFSLLPAGGKVFQIGVMLSRQEESSMVRLCVRDIPPNQILDYLIDIGWNGCVARLKETISMLSNFTDHIRLNFAVGDTVFPKIGFECYFERKPIKDPKLEEFLGYLVNHNLCTATKSDAIIAWSGLSHEKSDRQLWPQDLLKTSRLMNMSKLSMFARAVHHIKIVYEPDHPLKAKAYLSFWHLWLNLPISKQPLVKIAA
jgi:hypothetical protein